MSSCSYLVSNYDILFLVSGFVFMNSTFWFQVYGFWFIASGFCFHGFWFLVGRAWWAGVWAGQGSLMLDTETDVGQLKPMHMMVLSKAVT